MAKKIAIDIDIQGTKDVIDLQKAIKETNKELKKTEDVEAYDKLATDLIKLKSQLQEARRAQRQAVDAFKATDEGVGAYSRLSAQLRVARNNLKDLKASGVTTGEEVEKLTNEVNQLDTSLKDIDRSVGQTNREVGAYEEAVRKAVGITDAQTGAFTRLEGKAKILRRTYKDLVAAQGANSKEAKKLKKDLDQVEKELKQVSDAGQRTGRVMRSLRSEVRNVGPAFSGIANAFVVFDALPGVIAGIGQFAEGLNKVVGFLNPTVALNTRFAESIGDVTTEFLNEKDSLDTLFNSASADNENKQSRKAAVDQILEQYGPYLSDLEKEQLALGNVAAAQKAATTALIENLSAQAQKQQLTKIIDEFAQVESQRAVQAAEAETTIGGIADFATGAFGAVLSFSTLGAANFDTSLSNIQESLSDAQQSSLTAQAKNIDQVGTQTRNFLTDLTEELDATFGKTTALNEGTNKEIEKQNSAASKKIAADRARAFAQRLKQQESFEKSEIQAAKTRNNILLGIERQLIKTELDAQAAGLDKSIALEEDATEQKIAKLQEQEQKFIAQANKQQAAVNKAFGEGSQRALEIETKIAAEKIAISDRTEEAITAEQAASLGRRKVIAEDFAKQQASEEKARLDKRLTELNKERQAVAAAVNDELLLIRQKRAEGTIDAIEADNKAFDARKANLKAQLDQLSAEEIALQGLDLAVPQEQFDAIVSARQNLNTQLAELEEQNTKKVTDEQNKQSEARQKTLEQVSQGVGVALDAISLIADTANAAEISRIEALQEERAANIEGLNAQLSKASGLEKAFLKQKVAEEIAASEALAAQREKIEKKAAIANKALAIIQAVINTAVAVSAQLSVPVGGFALAALAGAIGAVEIATIAAQPLATGGIVGFNNGGRVSQGQNIATQPNGDNVLATLKKGEVVLNQGQQNRLGGASTFRAAGVPGFQTGGIVSPPMGAPSLAQAGTAEQNSRETLALLAKNLEATNSRIDKIQVVYTTETETAIDNDKKDRKEITQRATL